MPLFHLGYYHTALYMETLHFDTLYSVSHFTGPASPFVNVQYKEADFTKPNKRAQSRESIVTILLFVVRPARNNTYNLPVLVALTLQTTVCTSPENSVLSPLFTASY